MIHIRNYIPSPCCSAPPVLLWKAEYCQFWVFENMPWYSVSISSSRLPRAWGTIFTVDPISSSPPPSAPRPPLCSSSSPSFVFFFKCKIFSFSRGWMQNLSVLPYLKVSCLWSLTQYQQRAIFRRHVSQVLQGISAGRSSDSTSIWEK